MAIARGTANRVGRSCIASTDLAATPSPVCGSTAPTPERARDPAGTLSLPRAPAGS